MDDEEADTMHDDDGDCIASDRMDAVVSSSITVMVVLLLEEVQRPRRQAGGCTGRRGRICLRPCCRRRLVFFR